MTSKKWPHRLYMDESGALDFHAVCEVASKLEGIKLNQLRDSLCEGVGFEQLPDHFTVNLCEDYFGFGVKLSVVVFDWHRQRNSWEKQEEISKP